MFKKGFIIFELVLAIAIVILAIVIPSLIFYGSKRTDIVSQTNLAKKSFEILCLDGIEYYFLQTKCGYALAPKFINEGNTARISQCAEAP
jgi:hypothetical protein